MALFSSNWRTLAVLVALAGLANTGQASLEAQAPLGGGIKFYQHHVDPKILKALESHSDPVDAYVAVHPEAAVRFGEPRLLWVAGESAARWMTEGDKLRLQRQGKKFTDITDHEGYLKEQVGVKAGKAHAPKLTEKTRVKEAMAKVVPKNMEENLIHFSSYYTRHYQSEGGVESARWLHGEIAKIIATAPKSTHISLEQFPHKGFDQFSIIARFETKARNFSQPLTIVGAHLDSLNQQSPLLPAPGADDDGSGTVTTLEAFRVLAQSGFVPSHGPVEFHWYAGEECGGCGSFEIARYKRESGVSIGGMLQLDMTGYIARGVTPAVGVIRSGGDDALTEWTVALAREYSPIPAKLYELSEGLGSDHIAFTWYGFPSTMGAEGNPATDGPAFGEFCPYIHTANDTMTLDDEFGYFSVDHMARFAELALAFAIEQAK